LPKNIRIAKSPVREKVDARLLIRQYPQRLFNRLFQSESNRIFFLEKLQLGSQYIGTQVTNKLNKASCNSTEKKRVKVNRREAASNPDECILILANFNSLLLISCHQTQDLSLTNVAYIFKNE
jgi:hypothetical protein